MSNLIINTFSTPARSRNGRIYTGTNVSNSSTNAGGTSTNTSLLVPYSGATASVFLGANNITANILKSSVATGTAPLVVASTTVVTNLNADLLDGKHSTSFALAITGLTSNYLPKWSGTKLVDSLYFSTATGLAMGRYNTIGTSNEMAIGESQTIVGGGSFGIGTGNDIQTGVNNLAIGAYNIFWDGSEAVVIGNNNTINASRQIVIGSSGNLGGYGDMAIGNYSCVASTSSPSMMINTGTYGGDVLTQNNTIALLGAGDGNKDFFVGIGTTTPSYALTVVGSIYSSDKVITSSVYIGNAEILGTTNEGGIYSLSADQFIAVMDTVDDSDIYHYANDQLKFDTSSKLAYLTSALIGDYSISAASGITSNTWINAGTQYKINSSVFAQVVGGNFQIGSGTAKTIIVNELQTPKIVISNELQTPNLSTAPAGARGNIYFNTTDNHFYGYNGSVWKQLDN